MSIFHQALKQHLSYPSSKGLLNTEQLFELPLTSKAGFDLDTVAKAVNAQLKEAGEESFVNAAGNPARAKLALALDAVKAVIADKQADLANKASEQERAARRAVLLEAKADLQNAALKGMTQEQIDAELAKLG